MLIDSSGIQGS